MPFDLIRLTISDRVQDKMTLHITGGKNPNRRKQYGMDAESCQSA